MTQSVSIPPFDPIPGTSDGGTTPFEAQLRTADNAAHTLATFAIAPEDTSLFDVEVTAVKDDRLVGGWWKKSRAYLTLNGAITAGAQKDVDSEFIGVAPAWTVAIDATGHVVVNSAGDVVTWYVVYQRIEISVAAPIIFTATPSSGTHLGGTSVVLAGKGFAGTVGAPSVKVGGSNATSYVVDSDVQITLVTPVGVAGLTTIDVTTPTGTVSIPFTYT